MRRDSYEKAQFRYTIGYVVSAVLTLTVYVVTASSAWTAMTLAAFALVAAIAQLFVQSKYFLHLDEKTSKPRWKFHSYMFTWLILLVVVIGSLWVMINLNYNMMDMTPQEQQQYMSEHEGI